jgi:predicted HNH restriction endonuclease
MNAAKHEWRDVDAMSAEELLDEKIYIDGELGRIRNQIAEAKDRLATTGEYADRDWYRRAQGALRIFGQRSQRIQARLSVLRRAEKARNAERSGVEGDRFKHAFMRLVRERLGDAQYNELVALAQAETKP